jgi:uncharacterized membrane protein YgaE (UPF0421/DUF939 family)
VDKDLQLAAELQVIPISATKEQDMTNSIQVFAATVAGAALALVVGQFFDPFPVWLVPSACLAFGVVAYFGTRP